MNIGHGPLADHAAGAKVWLSDGQWWHPHQCRRGCVRIGECAHPGKCFEPASSATEVGADGGTVESFRAYATHRRVVLALLLLPVIGVALAAAAAIFL